MVEPENVPNVILQLDTIDSLRLDPGWTYNLNSIKMIKGTQDFLNLADATKNCQIEHYDNCTTVQLSKLYNSLIKIGVIE